VKRGEYDWSEVPYPVTIEGHATELASEDEHGAHVFLYVPDISVDTGWSTHRVPERKQERAERKVGFRR
jgi:hypothetical protein